MQMREIGAFEAKNKLSSLLDEIERGEEIVITRRGRAIAKLVPATVAVDREKTKAAARRIVRRHRGIRLEGADLKELIREGRP
jgi:prevent-host-death family protein